MKEYIQKLVDGEDLTREEAAAAMNIIMSGESTDAQTAGFLTALRMKGETIDEIAGCASVLSSKAEHISPKVDAYIDLVGTGGDRTFTFNVSTTASMAVAAAGLPVAKHGNRSISSKSGAGDVLEALGVNIQSDPAVVEKCVEEVGIGFMFAQTFIKAMRYVSKVRSELGIRTIFNILGPLSNPSDAKGMLVGVYDASLTETLVRAMGELGVKHAIVMSGDDHMDEITLTGYTTLSELKDGNVTTTRICPEDFGMKSVSLDQLQGGSGAENAEITKAILSGEKGPKRDIVLLNAGAGLYVGGATGEDELVAGIKKGIEMAADAIDSGKALKVLEDLAAYTNK